MSALLKPFDLGSKKGFRIAWGLRKDEGDGHRLAASNG
jgi:hypothetical protein